MLTTSRKAKKEKTLIEKAVLDDPATGDNLIVVCADDDKIHGLVLKKGKNMSEGWTLVIPPVADLVFIVMPRRNGCLLKLAEKNTGGGRRMNKWMFHLCISKKQLRVDIVCVCVWTGWWRCSI